MVRLTRGSMDDGACACSEDDAVADGASREVRTMDATARLPRGAVALSAPVSRSDGGSPGVGSADAEVSGARDEETVESGSLGDAAARDRRGAGAAEGARGSGSFVGVVRTYRSVRRPWRSSRRTAGRGPAPPTRSHRGRRPWPVALACLAPQPRPWSSDRRGTTRRRRAGRTGRRCRCRWSPPARRSRACCGSSRLLRPTAPRWHRGALATTAT